MNSLIKELIIDTIRTKKRLIVGTLKISNTEELVIDIIENDLMRLEENIIQLIEMREK